MLQLYTSMDRTVKLQVMIPSNQYTVKNTQQLFFFLEVEVVEANLLT